MAVTSTIEYCENTDVFDVFPDINKYRNTTRIIGWVVHSGDLYRADSCGLVTQLFTDGKELGDAEANSGVVNENDEWYYDSALDAVYYYNDATSPADMMMESGADYTTYLQRMRRKASRMVESQLDSRMAREIMNDREGLYPAYIIRATSLMTVLLILKANDPNNDYLTLDIPGNRNLKPNLERWPDGRLIARPDNDEQENIWKGCRGGIINEYNTQYLFHKWGGTHTIPVAKHTWMKNWPKELTENPPKIKGNFVYMKYPYFEKDIYNLHEHGYWVPPTHGDGRGNYLWDEWEQRTRESNKDSY